MASPPRRSGRDLSARRYLLILFLANAAGFFLLGWALESWGQPRVEWDKVTGVALLMGIVATDLVRRLAAVETDEIRSGFRAYRMGTRWLIFLWASLLGALGLSVLVVWLV